MCISPSYTHCNYGSYRKSKQKGILVKDGESLEELAKVNDLILDKTGTLTCGEPEVSEIISCNDKYSKKK